jgi:hypothetical protein
MPQSSQTIVKQGATDIISIENGSKLSDYIKHLPYGMIDKSVPNIGATHMELTDLSRNSIIVFPTRSLAATKADHHRIHYIGSEFQDVKPSSITSIRRDLNAGKRVKIAAVADSFIKLYKELGTELHAHSFFLMMDEIDSFQTESSYRPKLEECLDIYDKFPEDRRCLISATLETFSNSNLTSEKLTKIVVANYEMPELQVVCAPDSVLKVSAGKIIELFQPGYKLFIAFNSIIGIRKVLELLPECIQKESGILCSPQSYRWIKPYPVSQIKNGLLQHRVTFFTSAYFVGIDVNEEKDTVHSLIVTDTAISTSLISIAKIRQIFGRVRKRNKSQTLIINHNSSQFSNTAGFEGMLRSRQDAYENVLRVIRDEFGKLNLLDEAKAIRKAMRESCAINNVELLREKDGDVVISNLNIDYLRIQNDALKKLYVDIRNTEYNLRKHFNVTRVTDHSSLSKEDADKIEKVEEELKNMRLKEALDVLRSHITDPSLVEGKFNKIQTKVWSLAQPPIDVEKVEAKVLTIIKKGQDCEALKKVLFQIDVFSRSHQSELWKYLNMHFVVGRSYSGEFINGKLNEIARALNDGCPYKESKSVTESVRRFKKIYSSKRTWNPSTRRMNQLIQKTRSSEYCM